MRVASIGIGSNSLRMLVADIIGNKTLNQVLRDREGLRVFAALSEKNGGAISSQMCNQACTSINTMKQKAIELNTEKIHLFATSATRDASNKDEFLNAIYNSTGLKAEILTGEEEARLSFIGASSGVQSGMIDIGGGSTELAFGEKNAISYAHSFQIGAVRLSRLTNINNSNDIPSAYRIVKDILLADKQNIQHQISLNPNQIIFGVGGTFTSLAAYVLDIPWSCYEQINGFNINKADVEKSLYELSNMSIEDRKNLQSIQKNRADIIVYGILILYVFMDVFNIKAVSISTKGNLEGYLRNKYLN